MAISEMYKFQKNDDNGGRFEIRQPYRFWGKEIYNVGVYSHSDDSVYVTVGVRFNGQDIPVDYQPVTTQQITVKISGKVILPEGADLYLQFNSANTDSKYDITIHCE